MRDRYLQCVQKQELARVPIWSTLLSGYKGGNVLIMPHQNREELDLLLAAGVKPESVFAVDKSPAILATFTRKVLTASERVVIHRRGALVSEACKEWTLEGVRLEAAHFDFCANIEGWKYGSPRAELAAIARSGIIDNSRIAVTILKGRETREITKMFERVPLILAALNDGFRGRATVKVSKPHEYQNGPSPMLWTTFEISTKLTRRT